MNTKSRPERNEEKQGRCYKAVAFMLTAFHWPDIFPCRSPALLKVAHREKKIQRDCIKCTTSFPENFSYESKKFSIHER